MNSISRRQKIEAMLVDEPRDTFLRYSLAMELQKEGDHEASLRGFQDLMQNEPPHVPAFFMAAKLNAQLGRVAEARRVLQEGVEQAQAQGDQHAANEMSEFLLAMGAGER